VSLGLIVTELVINALKHGFPGGRRGTIKVDYRSDGAEWTLTVLDDGVGMPSLTAPLKGGLGSSIVTALAQQLNAQVQIADGRPGTEVRIVHVVRQTKTEAERPAAN
jgi:two-component sensor histidine kinase